MDLQNLSFTTIDNTWTFRSFSIIPERTDRQNLKSKGHANRKPTSFQSLHTFGHIYWRNP